MLRRLRSFLLPLPGKSIGERGSRGACANGEYDSETFGGWVGRRGYLALFTMAGRMYDRLRRVAYVFLLRMTETVEDGWSRRGRRTLQRRITQDLFA